MTIAGRFLDNSTAVKFGNTNATFTINSGTSITATSPAGSGTVNITVISLYGTTSSLTFTYDQLSASTTIISSSQNPSNFGQPVTFNANVTGNSPTGSVIFFDGPAQIGTATLSGGSATFTTSAFSLGRHSITATYSGDPNNVGSTSSALQQLVAVPADSQKLRQMQIAATQQSAQISGLAISGAIGNAIDDGFSDNARPVTPNGSGFTFNFAADEPGDPRTAPGIEQVKKYLDAPDRKATRLIDDEFAALGYAAAVAQALPKPIALQKVWLGWIDVRGVSVSNNSVGGDLSGNQVNVTAGLTHKLLPDFLIGVVGGYEYLDYSSNALNSRLRGNGWTVGGYLGWRVAQNIVFDIALARSSIDFDGTAGTATATFPGSRWLASGGLTGTYHWQALTVQPSARLYGLWEHDSPYTDTLGTSQGENNFSTGRASAGSKLSCPFAWTPSIALAPYIGAYGDYYFSSSNTAVAELATPAVLLQGWSARFTSGVTIKFVGGGQITAGGELGGVGSNANTKVWSYRIQGSAPF